MARRYNLQSSEGICTPGIIRAALNEMRGPNPGQQVWGLKLLMTGYPVLPGGIIASLMKDDGNVTMTIDQAAETVTLVCTDEQEAAIGFPKGPEVGNEKEVA